MATKKKTPHKLSKRPRNVRMFVYSEPGVGKTVLAGSSAEVGRTLILNADGPDGPESIRARGFDPDVYDVTSYRELEEVFQDLRHGAHKEYDWVWLDSVTLFQEIGMDEIMAAAVKAKSHRDPDIPDKREYLINQTKISKWVRHMRGVPVNFGMTAHVMSIEDEDGEVRYMPAVQGGRGNLSSKFCGYVGIVGHLYIKRVKVNRKEGDGSKVVQRRVLQTQPGNKFYAKDRFDALGDEVVNPTMSEIVRLINDRSRRKK